MKDDKRKKYQLPSRIQNTADMINVLKEREIFVDLFSNKEVCDMTMAQFSRDDILIYRGREEGRKEERLAMIEKALRKRTSPQIIADMFDIPEDEVKRVELQMLQMV